MPKCTKATTAEGNVSGCQCGCRGTPTLNVKGSRRFNHLRLDPSRTTRIVKRMDAEMKAHFRALKASIWRHVVMNDSYSLKGGSKQVGNASYEFQTSSNKIKAFKKWFQDQLDSGILSTDADDQNNWTSKYVYDAYSQGVKRSYYEEKAGEMGQLYKGGEKQFLDDAFADSGTQDSLEILYTRTYNDLEGVTSSMSSKMSRIMADALANGDSPEDAASAMIEEISGLERSRAELIAVTEMAYAQSEGQLNAYERMGIDDLGLIAEISTAGDDAVCEDCQEAAEKEYTVDEAHGIIPIHPRCRCAWTTADKKKRK